MKNDSSIKEMLAAIATVLSMATTLAAIITTVGTGLRLGLNQAFVIALAVTAVLIVVAVVYLSAQYRKAVRNIEEFGVAQKPQWLWRLWTHRITHRPARLIKGIVMAVVPPDLRAEAVTLGEIHNENKQYNLVFHFLPTAESKTKIDEDAGWSQLNVKGQSIDYLGSRLRDCAGIALLDDGNWGQHQRDYPMTWKTINDWSNTYTFRPIMAIRVSGEGDLKYSWCHLEETTLNRQGLMSHLLKLAVDRGKDWHDHSMVQRRFFRLVVWTLFVILGASIVTNFMFRSWMDDERKGHRTLVAQMVDDNTKRTKVMTTPGEQTKIAEHLYAFRSGKVDAAALLDSVVGEIQQKVVYCTQGSAQVMTYALRTEHESTQHVARIEEIASTRRPLREFKFQISKKDPNTVSIVGCALSERAFVHWTGMGTLDKRTQNIRAWDLEGNSLGEFDGKDTWKHNEKTCKFGDPPEFSPNEKIPDDPFRYLLCAPVGMSNDPWVQPAGAICISSEHDLKLDQSWARQLLFNYGNLLSFFSWDKIPKRQMGPQ